MENTYNNTTYITRDKDGNYRWTYDIDSTKNRSFLNLYLLIFGLIVLIPGAILFFMIYGRQISSGHWSGTGGYLGIWLLIFLGVELLTFLIYKGIEKAKGGSTDIPYLMNEAFIAVHPGTELAPRSYIQTDFSQVKDVKLDREHDLILLYEPLRVTHVYVPREDLPFVLRFILDHVPQTEKIRDRKKRVR